MNVIVLNREYDKAVIKKDLLNIAIQLLSDAQYTNEMAVEEIMAIIKEIDKLK